MATGKQVSFRPSAAAQRVLDDYARRFGWGPTTVLDLALRQLGMTGILDRAPQETPDADDQPAPDE